MDLKRNCVSIQTHPVTAPHTICMAAQQMVSCPLKRPSAYSQSLQCSSSLSPSLPPSLPPSFSPSLFFSFSPTEASRSQPLFLLPPPSLSFSVPSSHPFLPTTPPLSIKFSTQSPSTWHICLSLTSCSLNFTHMPCDLKRFPNVPLAHWKMFNTISHQVLQIKFQ